MRTKIKKYDKLIAFRLSSGALRGLEVLANRNKIGVSEFLRNCISELLVRRLK